MNRRPHHTMPDRVSHDLRDLLSESASSVHERERGFADLDGPTGRPIVLAGAGRLGRRFGEQLLLHGASVVAYVDNDPTRQGSTVFGVPVLAPSEASRLYGVDALFVVTIWNPEHSYIATYRQLTSLGCVTVVPWVPVAWALGDALLPQYASGLPSTVLAAREDVLAQAEVWADAESAKVYANQVLWRLTGDFADLDDPQEDQYFPRDVVRLGGGEAFVDCGAYTGDTVLEFVRKMPDFGAIHAFEPDAECFAALEDTVNRLDSRKQERIHLYRLATGSDSNVREFVAGDGPSGRIIVGSRPAGGAVTEVACARLEDVLGKEPVTFIKMDVEGAESAKLLGAANLIRKRRPLLAVSVYHLQSDLWELPKLVQSLTEDYFLYLRPHRPDSFDCVLYGVPAERRV